MFCAVSLNPVLATDSPASRAKRAVVLTAYIEPKDNQFNGSTATSPSIFNAQFPESKSYVTSPLPVRPLPLAIPRRAASGSLIIDEPTADIPPVANMPAIMGAAVPPDAKIAVPAAKAVTPPTIKLNFSLPGSIMAPLVRLANTSASSLKAFKEFTPTVRMSALRIGFRKEFLRW